MEHQLHAKTRKTNRLSLRYLRQTDWPTDRGDYIIPLWINEGSKIKIEKITAQRFKKTLSRVATAKGFRLTIETSEFSFKNLSY